MTSTPPSSQSLYRTWRSRGFSEVVGQGHVTQTLRNAVRTNSVGHAYLLTGPRGTGKTSTARILARAVNCLDPHEGEPCNRCSACLSMLENRCFDVIEIDAASNNSVDDMRDLREKVNFAPNQVRRKVYIIDEVHMLSTSAFNALLKTLEEPPPHVMFALATTDVYKVPVTVTSRCQRLDFRAITPGDIVGRLHYVCTQEGIAADEAALSLIAQQAGGSLRDALSLLDQVRAYEGQAIGAAEVEGALGLARSDTLGQLTAAVIQGRVGEALALVGELALAGADLRHYARQLIGYWRDLLLLRSGGEGALGRAADESLQVLARQVEVAEVAAMLKSALQPDYSGRRSASAQWQLELALIEASQLFTAGQPAASPRAVPSSAVVPTPGAPDTERDLRSSAVRARGTDRRAEEAVRQTPGSASPETESLPVSAALVVPLSPPAPPLATAVEQPPMVDAARVESMSQPVPEEAMPDRAAETPSLRHGVSDGVALASALTPQQMWAEVQRQLAQSADEGARKVAMYVREAVAIDYVDDTLAVGFTNGFMKGQADKPRARGPVEGILRELVGRAVSLRYDTIPISADIAAQVAPTESYKAKAERHLRGLHIDRATP